MKQSSAHTKDLPLCELKDDPAPFVHEFTVAAGPLWLCIAGSAQGLQWAYLSIRRGRRNRDTP